MKKVKIELAIGQQVWQHDRNKRCYVDDKGNATRGLWFRGQFVKIYVIGETSQSYIFGYEPNTKLENGFKFKKTELKNGQNIFLTLEDVDNACWVHDNRKVIDSKLLTCTDYDKLQRIFAILNED